MNNFESKGAKRSVNVRATNLGKMCFNNISLDVNRRQSKICSLHTYGVLWIHWSVANCKGAIWIIWNGRWSSKCTFLCLLGKKENWSTAWSFFVMKGWNFYKAAIFVCTLEIWSQIFATYHQSFSALKKFGSARAQPENFALILRFWKALHLLKYNDF